MQAKLTITFALGTEKHPCKSLPFRRLPWYNLSPDRKLGIILDPHKGNTKAGWKEG